MDIGKIIKDRRLELGLTLEEIGKSVGVSKSTVQKWENGYISNMKRDKISALSKILDISPVSLIIGEQEETPSPSKPIKKEDEQELLKLKQIISKELFAKKYTQRDLQIIRGLMDTLSNLQD